MGSGCFGFSGFRVLRFGGCGGVLVLRFYGFRVLGSSGFSCECLVSMK